MGVYLYLEAGQSRGKCYRLGLGWVIHANIASVMAALSRLF